MSGKQNTDEGMPVLLLAFLGACIYGDAETYFLHLDEANRKKLERQGRYYNMSPWFYRFLYQVLPEEKKAEYRKIYLERQAAAVFNAREMERLFGVLSEHGLRFVPIKGADLAYRLYGDAALRRFVDWDIWFHPDDCKTALDVLASDGWRVQEHNTDLLGEIRKSAPHHFAPHVRNGFCVEPHFTLSNFSGIDTHEMWTCTREMPGGHGQRVLSPELNLLMLARHAATHSYFHASIPKLLTDAAMILLHDKPDFAALRALAAHWGLPYPGNMLAAFPEFFPPEVIAEFHADPEKTALFRQLFEKRTRLGNPRNVAIMLNKLQDNGNAVRGIVEYLHDCDAEKMRCVYHLSTHNNQWRLAWAYVQFFCTRTWWTLCTWIRHDRRLRDYCRLVESLEQNPAGSCNQP